MRMCVLIRTYVCMYVCMCACMHANMHVHETRHARAHAHMHAHNFNKLTWFAVNSNFTQGESIKMIVGEDYHFSPYQEARTSDVYGLACREFSVECVAYHLRVRIRKDHNGEIVQLPTWQ